MFNLHELEKLGVKKGIVYNMIKEVLITLISDDLVDQDKMGAGNFFWALPSKALSSVIFLMVA